MFQFAVLGDAHYVRLEGHQNTLNGHAKGPSEYDDTVRNHAATLSVLPAFLREVKDAQPDFVIHTGDLVHGHCDSQDDNTRETLEAHALMQTLDVPVFFAMGTHDGVVTQPDTAHVDALIKPAIAKHSVLQTPSALALGVASTETYYSFVREDSLFIILDYTIYRKGEQQSIFLRETLEKSRQYSHVFLFAHPPLIPIGRPFFTKEEFAADLLELCRRYRPDAYFCGHTHNQIVSLHKLGDYMLPQLQTVSTGYSDGEMIPYLDVRRFLPSYEDCRVGWAYMEDSPPGFYLVHVDGVQVNIEWHVMNIGCSGAFVIRRDMGVEFTKLPTFTSKKLTKLPELRDIRAIRVRGTGTGIRQGELTYTLNGYQLTGSPWLEYFDARRVISLGQELWQSIVTESLLRENFLQVNIGEKPACIGGFLLEIETEYGTLRSQISPYFVNDSRWQNWQDDNLLRVAPNTTISVPLNFSFES